MQDETRTDLIALIERCLVDNDNDAWQCFLEKHRYLIERAIRENASPRDASAIVDAFPGWMFQNRKLHALYRRVIRARSLGEVESQEQIQSLVENYLYTTVGSSVSDWYRKQRPLPDRLVPESDIPPETAYAPEVTLIRDGLRTFDAAKRIPFWLRHYPALGGLDPGDLQYIADIHSTTPEAIEERIATYQREIAPKQTFSV